MSARLQEARPVQGRPHREGRAAELEGVGREEPLVVADNLSVGYGGRALVDEVCLAVVPGQVVSLIGPNGAGKSTILKTMAGLLEPVGGTVLLGGADLRGLSAREQSRMRAALFTEGLRTELLTCADVVRMGRYPFTGRLGVAAGRDEEVVRRSMGLLKVEGLADADFMQLSDGQRQRVLLARALCQEPKVLLLDEPTSYLDVRYQVELLALLRDLVRATGLGVVMSLHELSLARQASDWLVCIKEGAVLAQGPPGEVFVDGVIRELFDLEPGMLDAATGTVVLNVKKG